MPNTRTGLGDRTAPQTSMAAPKLLLIAEDRPIRRLLSVRLRDAGYLLFGSTTGRGGVRLTEEVKPQLVVLDLALPDLDGIQVVRLLRHTSIVPILALSARDDEDEIVATLDSGADLCVTKPFDVDVLLARIRAVLRASAYRRVRCGDRRRASDRAVYGEMQRRLNEQAGV